jgi:hypothetical protein
LLHPENEYLTHEDLNTSIEQPGNRWNIHLVSYDTLTSRAKPSSNGRLTHCFWSFGIFDMSHRYKPKNSMGWQIATNARFGFKLQVTTTLGCHSLYDWCYQTMWLFSGASEDPEDETVMEMHRTDVLYSAVKSLMHAIWNEDQDAQHDAAHWMIQNAKPWMIRRWSELKLANGKPLVWIPKGNGLLVDLEWTKDEQGELKILVERYTSWSASGAWRVHQWHLSCFSLVLGETVDQNEVSGQWYNEWPLDTWVDPQILRWLRDTFLPMLVNESVEYPKQEEDEASNEALLHEAEYLKSTLPHAPPPLQKAVLFCHLPR